MRAIYMGVSVLAAACLIGCGGSEKSEAPKVEKAAAPSGPAVSPDEVNGGTVSGKVVFSGEKPHVDIIDMSAVPACANAHKVPVKSQVAIVNRNGTLKN